MPIIYLSPSTQDWNQYVNGGTEEEWGDREMDVVIDYEIKSQTKEWVSFIVSFAEAWVSVYEECYYYNLDFTRDEELTLQDFLGENWVSICNNAIQKQIDKGFEWQIQSNVLEGTDGSEYVYSIRGHKTYVMIPDEESIEKAKVLMKETFGNNP